MPDRHRTFASLAASETADVDYRIRTIDRKARVLIMAPHGGAIEPGTSEIAISIAAETHSLYCFEGILPGRPHGSLHIASTRLDEPNSIGLICKSDIVLAIHGRKDAGDRATIWVGGLDRPFRASVYSALSAAGYGVSEGRELAGEARANICNRGRNGAGVQLEFPRSFRASVVAHRART
jgi:phage replication-related protein YjqB (UPF0714/DUF867 family)